jgi:hypothetical protein
MIIIPFTKKDAKSRQVSEDVQCTLIRTRSSLKKS